MNLSDQLCLQQCKSCTAPTGSGLLASRLYKSAPKSMTNTKQAPSHPLNHPHVQWMEECLYWLFILSNCHQTKPAMKINTNIKVLPSQTKAANLCYMTVYLLHVHTKGSALPVSKDMNIQHFHVVLFPLPSETGHISKCRFCSAISPDHSQFILQWFVFSDAAVVYRPRHTQLLEVAITNHLGRQFTTDRTSSMWYKGPPSNDPAMHHDTRTFSGPDNMGC